MKSIKIILEVLLIMSITQTAYAVSPTPDELHTARRWAAATFEGTLPVDTPDPSIRVAQSWDSVQKNGRFGRKLQIAGKKYENGLYCHAPAKIMVRLPKPGKTFNAVLGIDDALQWDVKDYPSGPIWPEVTVSIKVNDKEIFKSETIKIGMAGIPLSVNLNEAIEFAIEVTGARKTVEPLEYLMTDEQKRNTKTTKSPRINEWGDTDIADASVTFVDDSSIRLDEMLLPGNMVKSDIRRLPFSFTYGSKSSASLFKKWEKAQTIRRIDVHRTERLITFTDPDSGLVVRCIAVEYSDYPIVEWTVYFKNTGDKKTAILKDIKALDLRLDRGPTTEYLLHHSLGSSCRADDFRPMETLLQPDMKKRFAPVTGYSTDPDMSYFNIELASGEGIIMAIGWPGQWSADFIRDSGTGLNIFAGQETSHFRLMPGEEVRTPLIVLQFWQGSWIRSQNVWRKWMIAHNLPKSGGEPLGPMMNGSAFAPLGYTGVTESNQKEYIDRYDRECIKLNWWWIDYGWHEGPWTPAKERFPNGLKPVTDYVRSTGKRTIVWFAPEHSPLGGKPEWLLKAKGEEPLCRGQEISALNLGDPEAWKWLVEMVDNQIVDGGIDCYRHDTSWGPLANWRSYDKPDRQGITENHYVTGFLAFYDELLRRHPKLLIDNCCRGGRRNDIETMRRSIPLWRSDYAAGAVSQQSQTYGASLWLPFHGIGQMAYDTYEFRSAMTPSTLLFYDMMNKAIDFNFVRRMSEQWWAVSLSYFGDYYPLTPYNIDGGWMAWQFNNPEKNEGFVQVFRRNTEPGELMWSDSMHFRLQGLDAEAKYAVKDMDAESPIVMTGADLMSKGIYVTAGTSPAAWLFSYRKNQ